MKRWYNVIKFDNKVVKSNERRIKNGRPKTNNYTNKKKR